MRTIFSSEQIAKLKQNTCVFSCGQRSISYTYEFMSRKGKCIDNAPIESFFGHMKDELDYNSCQSFEQLRLAIDEYMRYYNHERKQWTRNKMTPVAYRDHLLTKVEG